MDEKIKHRLIGFCVIFATIAIVAPVFFKSAKPVWKSSHERRRILIPPAPDKARVVEKEMATDWEKPLQVAHISIDSGKVALPTNHQVDDEKLVSNNKPTISKVIAKRSEPEAETTNQTVVNLTKTAKVLKSPKPVRTVKKLKPVGAKITLVKKNSPKKMSPKARAPEYQVLLGSFAYKRNVNTMLKQLKKMGYQAFSEEVVAKGGKRYTRVFVGKISKKNDAIRVAGKLIKHFNLSGYFVLQG